MKRELTKLEKFLTLDFEAQCELLKDPETKAQVQAWMGADAFSQFEKVCVNVELVPSL